MIVMTIVGARPEFIQTAPVSKAVREEHTEILVHTGQHYDASMSDVFFRELELPAPDVNLEVGSGGHGWQTGTIMSRLEPIMQAKQPDWVLVYGDTNSTLAGALTASKLHIPIAHIEAGLRSFDRAMPEEINRIVTDHLSRLLFAPTEAAVGNLASEGITKGVKLVGDVRVDVLMDLVERVKPRSVELLTSLGLAGTESFALATIHRAQNTDDPTRLHQIVRSFGALDLPVILPIHPRLQKKLSEAKLQFESNVYAVPPLGFFDMVALIKSCAVVITDSGGLQKEAYMLYRPTVTVRDSTEWVETISSGWNRLCEPALMSLRTAVETALNDTPNAHPDFYGAPGVSQRIVSVMEEMRQTSAFTSVA